MGSLAYVKDFVTVASILSLLVVGVLIALKSGVVTVSGGHCRMVLGNLSQLILTLVGCMLVLTMLQEMIGFRIGLSW